MVGWHHGLNGHEFEQILGRTEGQGSLLCYSAVHGVTESDLTELVNCYYFYLRVSSQRENLKNLRPAYSK